MSEPENADAPPVIDPQPGPAPAKSNAGKYVLITVFVLLGGILLLGGWFLSSIGNLANAFMMPASDQYEEVTMREGNSDERIAVIRVRGIISSYGSLGDSMVTQVKKQLDFAAADDSVKAVVLQIDSPGGEVLASDEIARAIREFQTNTGRPVVASMSGMAASGGYYIAAPCQKIVAHDLTITGSIGVIMQSINLRGLMDKVGVQPITFKSGDNKNMLDPFSSPDETTDAQKQILQDFIDTTYERFVNEVERGRGERLAENWRDKADGRILTGKQAQVEGMVDELGNFDDAVKSTEKLANIPVGRAQLIRNDPPVHLGGLLRLLGQAREKDQAPTLKLDLGFDLPELKAGMPYFLSSHLFAE